MILFTSYTPMRETKPYPNEEIKPPAKPDRLTNKELLTKAATGDQAAFAELYQKYSPDLKSFIMGKTHSQSDTEEIVQTAWQNILPKLDMSPDVRIGNCLAGDIGDNAHDKADYASRLPRGLALGC